MQHWHTSSSRRKHQVGVVLGDLGGVVVWVVVVVWVGVQGLGGVLGLQGVLHAALVRRAVILALLVWT